MKEPLLEYGGDVDHVHIVCGDVRDEVDCIECGYFLRFEPCEGLK